MLRTYCARAFNPRKCAGGTLCPAAASSARPAARIIAAAKVRNPIRTLLALMLDMVSIFRREVFTQLAVRPHRRLWAAVVAHLTATVGLRCHTSRIGASCGGAAERRGSQHWPNPSHPRWQGRVRFALVA